MNAPGRYIVPAIFFAGIFSFLIAVHHVLLPFVLAATLAYLLNPLVVFFEVRGVRRRVAVWVVFVGFMGMLLFLTHVALTIATIEASRVSMDVARASARLSGLCQSSNWLTDHFPALRMTLSGGSNGKATAWLWDRTPTLAMKLLPLLELTLLVPFLALFFMLDGLVLREAALSLVPARYVEMLLSIIVEIDESLGNYLRGICLEALFIGVVAALGFWAIGLDDAIQIAVWVGVTSMVPFLGALVAAVVGSAVALMQWGTLAGLVKVLVVVAGIRLSDDWLLQPLILQKAVHLHPAGTVFAVMAGVTLFGFWGLLFAVPVLCMVKVLMQVAWEWYTAEYGLRRGDTIPVEVSHIPLI